MARRPRQQLTEELGASSRYALDDALRADEFIRELRGELGNLKYREMRDNDPTIGGALMAFERLIGSAQYRLDPVDDSQEAADAVELMEGMFDDMEHTWDEFLTNVTTFLAFGFAIFEKVFKVRRGRTGNPVTNSKFDDGLIGYRKLAPRAQWTVDKWIMDETGRLVGVRQYVPSSTYRMGGRQDIPIEKLVHFRTSAVNDDPTGRSILRNAYLSYHYASHIDMIEAIGIERELNGIPVIRIPSQYLGSNATAEQKAFRRQIEKLGRDVKFNDQGYVIIPSDPIIDEEGRVSQMRKVEFELMSSPGTRAIPTGDTINRHRKNIAQSILADFLTLGQGDRGSFALSKSKTDLFLAAGMGIAQTIAATIDRQIIQPIWDLNGMDPDLMPKSAFDDIAPADLEELGAFVQSLAAAGMPLFPDEELENTIRLQAGFPERKEDDMDIMGTPLEEDLDDGTPPQSTRTTPEAQREADDASAPD